MTDAPTVADSPTARNNHRNTNPPQNSNCKCSGDNPDGDKQWSDGENIPGGDCDNGVSGTKFGCDDSLVAVEVPIAPTVGVLRAALNQLLSLKSSYYGQSGLYTALYQSD